MRQHKNRFNQTNTPFANQNQRCQSLKQPPPPEPAYTMPRPPWPDFSNGVWPLSLNMAANNPKRYRPLFNVIPPFIFRFPRSFVGNLIPCRAAKTNKVKEAPRKVFAFEVVQPLTLQPSPESWPVGFEEAFGKTPQLHLTEWPLSELIPAQIPIGCTKTRATGQSPRDPKLGSGVGTARGAGVVQLA